MCLTTRRWDQPRPRWLSPAYQTWLRSADRCQSTGLGFPDTHPLSHGPRIHSFAARKFGAKPRPLVISTTQKASARGSANGGCLTSPARTPFWALCAIPTFAIYLFLRPEKPPMSRPEISSAAFGCSRDREAQHANDDRRVQDRVHSASFALLQKLDPSLARNRSVRTLDDVRILDLSSGAATDEDMVHVALAKNVVELSLATTAVTDLGMTKLEDLISLEVLDLTGTSASDEGLNALKSLRRLQRLNLDQTRVGGRGRSRWLPNCRELTSLRLCGTPVVDSDLKELSECKKLTHLVLDGTHLKGEFLTYLDGCDKLESLSINDDPNFSDVKPNVLGRKNGLLRLEVRGTAVGDATIARLPIHLETLNLEKTRITDQSSLHLPQLKWLLNLNLTGTRISNETVKNVGRLTHLQSLMLADTDITDECLPELSKLRELKLLDLTGTRLTDRAIAKLKAFVPGVICLHAGGLL